MSIAIRCPNCRELVSVKRSSCPRCGNAISTSKRDFWVRYRKDGQSVKKRLGYISLREAKDIELKLLAESKNNAPNKNELTWGRVVDAFLARLKAEKKSSRYITDTSLYLLRMKDYWGNCLVSEISPSMIKEFRVRLLEAELSEASADRHLAAGKTAFNHCVDYIPNPFSRVQQLNPDNTVVRFLSDEERNRLLDAANKINKNLYEMLLVSLSTGLRKRNVIELKRTEVNFKTGLITLQQKGGYRHSIVMNEICYSTLVNIADNGTEYFWLSPFGKPFHIDWRKPWLRAKKLAGLPEEFRWHDLRHDTATRVYAAGKDLYAVSKFLGHRATRTTERYAHFVRENMEL